MEIKNLFTNDRAVSPVIGVILMVAITVILAAVIGTFVIGLGDDLGSTTPSASIDAGPGNGVAGDVSDDAEIAVFTHRSGDSISHDNLEVVGNFEDDFGIDKETTGSQFSAGNTVTVVVDDGDDGSIAEGDSVSLIFDDGSRSSTLSTYTFTDSDVEE